MRLVYPTVKRKKQVLSGLLMMLLLALASCPIKHAIKACFAQNIKAAQHPKQSAGSHNFASTGFASCSFEKESSEKEVHSVRHNHQNDRDLHISSSNVAFLSQYDPGNQIIPSGSAGQGLSTCPVPLFLRYRSLLI